jgi:hypothetical protein|tara:strand:- start:1656 stop:1862 length:207 start_codon:yes stop_codon:yes gene_type:complete
VSTQRREKTGAPNDNFFDLFFKHPPSRQNPGETAYKKEKGSHEKLPSECVGGVVNPDPSQSKWNRPVP